jgi:hypothetical protein
MIAQEIQSNPINLGGGGFFVFSKSSAAAVTKKNALLNSNTVNPIFRNIPMLLAIQFDRHVRGHHTTTATLRNEDIDPS